MDQTGGDVEEVQHDQGPPSGEEADTQPNVGAGMWLYMYAKLLLCVIGKFNNRLMWYDS